MPSNTFPKSVVRVTSISGPLPAMFMRPTEDSGFAWVLAEKIRLTASACASHLDGLKMEDLNNLRNGEVKITTYT